MQNISEKMIKRTTSQQYEKLVSLLQQHPDIATGIGNFGSTKQQRSEMWSSFATELNSLGPPMRTGSEWNKVWLDYKLKLKRKIADNRNEAAATGGGPYAQRSLTPLEQAVDGLMSLQKAANPPGNAYGPPSSGVNTTTPPARVNTTTTPPARVNTTTTPPGRVNTTTTTPDGVNTATTSSGVNTITTSSCQEESSPTTITGLPNSTAAERPTTSRQRNIEERENVRLSTLQKQTEVQEALLKAIKGIDRKLDDIGRYAKKAYKLKKEEVELLKIKEEGRQFRCTETSSGKNWYRIEKIEKIGAKKEKVQ